MSNDYDNTIVKIKTEVDGEEIINEQIFIKTEKIEYDIDDQNSPKERFLEDESICNPAEIVKKEQDEIVSYQNAHEDNLIEGQNDNTCIINEQKERPLSNAERQKKYREQIKKANPILHEEVLARARDRKKRLKELKKIKSIKDMTSEEQEAQRKYWRERKILSRSPKFKKNTKKHQKTKLF